MAVVVQKLKKEYNGSLEVAIQYVTIISAFNSLHLTKREIQLLAFTALKGNISSGGKKDEFISIFGSSIATIGNIIHKLGKKKLLQHIEGKTKIHPSLQLDFSKDIILQLHIHAKG